MRFEFATATRIIFGPGTVRELPAIARGFGTRAMVVTGKYKLRHAGVIASLEESGCHCTLFGVPGEPTVALVQDGAAALRNAGSQFVIGIGGGSVIDAGKAIAALGANPAGVLEYIEVIGKGKALERPPFPFIAIPTTAGTGSEVTRNAVLSSPEHGVKASLRSPMMLPMVALVDPDLTLGLPRDITAATGLDAATQLIEAFVSNRANPLTDALCRDGLRSVSRNLVRAYTNGSDAEARSGMAYASLLGGLALANSGLGVVHGFAAPIGGQFDAPHGAVCAALLPHAIRINTHALRTRAPESGALTRYAEVDGILGADWADAVVRDLNIPLLRRYGVATRHTGGLVDQAERASSMKANPIVLKTEELNAILTAAL